MKVFIFIAILGLSLSIFEKSSKNMFLTEESLTYRKTQASFETFSFEEHPFKDWTFEEVKKLMGVRDITVDMDTSLDIGDDSHFPDAFDARVQWPECIHPIRNQGKCGSCWAFAATGALSDRFCIASKNKINVVLSPEDLLECDFADHGCNGGIPYLSWVYLRIFGVETEDCNPYSAFNGKVDKCKYRSECKNKEISSKKYKTKEFPSRLKTVELIKKDIMLYGPVETGLQVFEDFMDYKSGVYTHKAGKYLGGHAVKIVGWGVDADNGINYWIAANSWGSEWGEKGYFRIQYGECGFEKSAIASVPELS